MTQSLPLTVILAGGAGRRMGGNKPFYAFDGAPLIQSVIEALHPQSKQIHINAGTQDRDIAAQLMGLGYPLCFDDLAFSGLGPLSGVRTAMRTAAELGEVRVVTAPCDMPRLPTDMIPRLLRSAPPDADVTHIRGQRDYPLCALWNVHLLAHLDTALANARKDGGLSVMRYLSTCSVNHVDIEDDDNFVNVNAPVNDLPAE